MNETPPEEPSTDPNQESVIVEAALESSDQSHEIPVEEHTAETLPTKSWWARNGLKVATGVLTTFIGAIAGGVITVQIVEPYQECRVSERYYLSSIHSLEYEIETNKERLMSLQSSMVSLILNQKDAADKKHNAQVSSQFPAFTTSRFEQVEQYHDQLVPELLSFYPEPQFKVGELIENYRELNRKTDYLKTTIIASLGFLAEIHAQYLPLSTEDIYNVVEQIELFDIETALKDLYQEKNTTQCPTVWSYGFSWIRGLF